MRTIAGQTISLEVESSDTVEDVKTKLQDKAGFPSKMSKLIYNGELLVNRRLFGQRRRTLASYNVQDGSTFNLLFMPTARELAELHASNINREDHHP